MRLFGGLFLVAFAGAASAQVTTATFYGMVTDPTGGVVPDAAVALIHEGTGAAAARKTDSAGEFVSTAPAACGWCS